MNRYYYRFLIKDHPFIPYRSLVELSDYNDEGRFSFIYKDMWFGYYDMSVFQPLSAFLKM